MGRPEGLTKVIADADTNRVLGVGIVGEHAGDLIAEAVLAIEMGAEAEDLALTIHPHPATSETIMEAAESVMGSAIHMLKR
jgi:dihydrolipoamide dehydrogenase